MEFSHNIAMRPLNSLGMYLDGSTIETENVLRKEYGINTNQWMFSLENIEMLEQINTLADLTFKEVSHISRYNSVRYLIAWFMLQRLYLTSHEKRMATKVKQLDIPKDSPKLYDLRQAQEECLYFAIYANGTYGKVLNTMYNDKRDLNRLIRTTNYTEDFVFHTKIQPTDVLHSFWDTTPYKPAHVIARDEFKKSIVLCMRGTHHWADAVTDLDFHYLSFSIVRNNRNQTMFLKFHYNERAQEYLKKKIGDDTRYLNEEEEETKPEDEEILVTGYSHAGMLVSAIGAYKEISPKVHYRYRTRH